MLRLGRSGELQFFLFTRLALHRHHTQQLQSFVRNAAFSTGTPCFRFVAKHPPAKFDKPLASANLFRLNPSRSRIKQTFQARLTAFPRDRIMRKKALSFGIPRKLFDKLSRKFVHEVQTGKVPNCNATAFMAAYNHNESIASANRFILSSFFDFAKPLLPKDVLETFNSLRKLSDIRFPSEWFPEARQMQRKIYLHVGPTNSGKTYRALKRLAEAESGIYCGPLRLLAHEIFEKMNNAGVPCNLLTGEERREVSPTAPLTSSTVEMANLHKKLEVAVIDEIQMIGDSQRGWAWTQALLGLQAKEIHLCGEASVVPLVKRIAESLNEEVIVNEYNRLTPVTVVNSSLNGDWSKIKKGDCVVTFSRQGIFNIKEKIEKETGLKCAVAYGGLPPETRALQAKSFNDPNSDIDVLVASDAVGMGLNLNIKRIVFDTVYKFDGIQLRPISVPQLKQIGGRAGRFGTVYSSGEVTAMKPADLQYTQEAMSAKTVPLSLAGLQPTIDIFELFAMQLPNEPFSGLLQKFEDLASLDGDYFLCNFRDQKTLAETIEHIPLALRDRYQFVTAPVNTRNKDCLIAFSTLAEAYSKNEAKALDQLVTIPDEPVATPEALESLETSHRVIMLYMWLSLRYPDHFITVQDEAYAMKQRCEEIIDESLRTQTALVHALRKKEAKRKFQNPLKKKKRTN